MAGRVPGPGRSSVSRHSHSNHGNGPSHRLTGKVPAVAGPSLPGVSASGFAAKLTGRSVLSEPPALARAPAA